MCGIVGYLSRSGNTSLGHARLAFMRDTMLHRGPDGYGIELFEAGRVGLAHRRLAIIDLSSAGHEPMSFHNQRFWLTFNGEIYNAEALREDLITQGCRFRSACDAEVLLASYATWGKDCVQRFHGMWAFAIWDAQEKILFCSRDRFGIKPFYYYDNGDLFAFASEIRAILASGSIPIEPHCDALIYYLEAGLIDGLEDTFFQSIKRLQPGYCLRISEHGSQSWRYWDLLTTPISDEDSTPHIIEKVRSTFQAVVRSHLVSDVPLGVSLSGGLDSSSIFGIASQLKPGPICTFTSYYEEPGPFDERLYSDQMTALYPAHEYQVYPKREQLFQILPRIIWHLEEPPLAHGVYPRWHIAELASHHIKVLLVGQGGDELLAGYSHYVIDLFMDYLSQGQVLRTCRELAATWNHQGVKIPVELLKTSLKEFLPRQRWRKLVRPSTSVLGPLLKNLDLSFPQKHYPKSGQSRLNEHLYYDLVHGTLPTLLKYEDKIDMAFSIEGRVPFLDHRFAELCFSLGSTAKIRDGWGKAILRDAMAQLLPSEVCWRREKIGFPTPFNIWFRGSLFRDAKERIMESNLHRDGYLDRRQVERVLKEHSNEKRNHSQSIWKWLCLAIWFEGSSHLSDRSYAARTPHAT